MEPTSPQDRRQLLAELDLTATQLRRYRIGTTLGEGGMGVVVEARDEQLQRQVALKFMRPELAQLPSARALFLSEARAIAALNHPNIVQVFDVGEIQSVQGVIPYMAMERLTGESLDRLLNRKFDFSPSQIIKIAYKVAIALQHAHQACIIHRDIKPANVFLQLPGGNVKVLDFGLARTLRAAQMRVPANTMNDDSLGKGVSDAVLVGTPGYVSPEQAQDRPVDGRSDLFSLGILMYRMASGRLPFDGDTTAEQLVAMMVGTPAPLNDSCTGFDRAFYQLVDACLQKQKRNRPPSAAAVADSLREILSSMKDGE
ncbi:MAG: serine/threonine-protein kinase, partial [Planctomycetota bacterium]